MQQARAIAMQQSSSRLCLCLQEGPTQGAAWLVLQLQALVDAGFKMATGHVEALRPLGLQLLKVQSLNSLQQALSATPELLFVGRLSQAACMPEHCRHAGSPERLLALVPVTLKHCLEEWELCTELCPLAEWHYRKSILLNQNTK